MAKNKARVKIDAHEARLAAQREVYAQLDKIQADMSRQMTRDYMACLLLVLHLSLIHISEPTRPY